jgi:adenosylcobinamide-phosphate synthase
MVTGEATPTARRRMGRRTRLRRRAGAVALGLAADALLGEPQTLHPVAGFGQAMTRAEEIVWSDDLLRGTAYAASGIGAAAAAGVTAARVVGEFPAVAAATFLASSGRMLLATAADVAEALEDGDLDRARAVLPALVGRATDGLTEKEIARAVVESVAENLSDAVVASVLWGVVGGAPAVLAHRAANTLDAMVGHKSDRYRRFGWASARADDVLGWPAARATALLVALVCPTRATAVWRAVRRDAPRHPSPNAGVSEASFAAALGLRLGGTNRYGGRVEVRSGLGDGRPPERGDIRAAIALARKAIVACALALLAISFAPASSRSARS